MNDAEVERLRQARELVLARIADACGRVGRQPTDVTLVAVTKTVPAERLLAAVAAGLIVFGENRVQEAEPKVAAVAGARWHLVGPLQGNKARRAIASFDMIEAVDSVALARRLDRMVPEAVGTGRFPVLLEVNVDADESKAGFSAETLEAELPVLLDQEHLDVRGLMTVGRLVESGEDARPTFVALRRLSESLRVRDPRLGAELSMGMSDDFPIAIEEGATIVRIGRALFGERHDHHH